jgi:hypothetical protein
MPRMDKTQSYRVEIDDMTATLERWSPAKFREVCEKLAGPGEYYLEKHPELFTVSIFRYEKRVVGKMIRIDDVRRETEK